MGAEGFHGRVRDGIGCLAPRYGHQAGETPFGCEVRREVSREVSGAAWACAWLEQGLGAARGRWCGAGGFRRSWAAPVAAVQRVAPASAYGSSRSERLVPVSCGDCSLSTSGLSTWWSTTALGETWF